MRLTEELVRRIERLLGEAREAGDPEPTAMVLATADAVGRVSARSVLLKGLDRRGLVFYTHLGSRKGDQMAENPRAAACFLFKTLAQQVQLHVEGEVIGIAVEEADAYFATRPRGSQIGAWASRQSRELADRQDFEDALAGIEARYDGVPVPRPPWWGGLRLVPDRLEFWHGERFRWHRRHLLTFAEGRWLERLLYP